jgi:ssRNA-specific RNase YbeY (16S rRNA maturation enzyme)
MFVHGILHLLGIDHDTKSNANHMEMLEINILKMNEISNPYEFDSGNVTHVSR